MNASFRTVFAAATILAAAATAQNATATFTSNYGNATFGGRVQLAASSNHTVGIGTESSALAVSARGDVRLNGVTREAAFARFDARADSRTQLLLGRTSRTTSASSALQVRIGGRTVVSQSATQTQRSVSSVTPGNVFSGSGVSASYAVGPFTLSVTTQATAGVSYDATAALSPSTLQVDLNGFVRTFANGRSATVLGIPGLSVGATSTLTFANNRVNLAVTASPTRVSGSMSWRTEAVRLLVDLFAEVFPVRYTLRLIDLSIGVTTGARTLL